ncbi:hypothetical protein FB446DRAFT_680534 [Lentinula raphanica]|nr:hypothetical protein FB446DRAFT_680534 [Lentinula raphanica]
MATTDNSTDNTQPSHSPSPEAIQPDASYTTTTATTPMSQTSITAIHSRTPSGDDPQAQLISTLRGQIQDLFTQVTQLNSKLVQSYDRVSDLEDDLHMTQSNLRQSTLKISQLELERTQHLSALNTGMLVERSNVVEELTRLMERATQEAAQRSSAESARRNIETELEELSKDLFEGANGMVAEARYERFLSQKRAEDSERRAKEVEEKLVAMQQEMRRHEKGKWVPRTGDLVRERNLMSSHVPYQEFIGFIGHLRGLHGQSGQAIPAMTTLLGTPFLTRIATEDSDPTLRLDLAPSFNWLSRRSVLAAIHNGCLVVEPMSSSDFMQQVLQRQQRQGSTGFNLNNLTISVGAGGAGNTTTSHNTVACALCGTNIFPGLDSSSTSSHSQSVNQQPTGAWPTSMSLFRKGSSSSLRTSQTSQGNQGITPPPSPPLPSKAKPILGVDSSAEAVPEHKMPEQVFVFRIRSTSPSTNGSTTPSAAPVVSSQAPPPVHPPVTQAAPTRRGRSGTVSQSPFGSPTKAVKPAFTSPFSSQSSSAQPNTSNAVLNGNARLANSGNGANTASNVGTLYPLCTSTWCLTRLRATCEIWTFIRSGVIEKVWEEDVPSVPSPTTHSGVTSMPEPPPTHPSQPSHTHTSSASSVSAAPPIPPRKRGLWGTLETLSERAASWGGGSQSGSRPGTPSTPNADEKKLPILPSVPPPVHPTLASDKETTPAITNGSKSSSVSDAGTTNFSPPPLPKRNEGRIRPSSTSAPLQSVAEADDAAPDPSNEHKEDNDHTGSEVVFTASPHHSPVQDPTKLPLPDSRPATPVINSSISVSRPSTPSNKPPSRPSTPSTKTEIAPPPLPRRAVARGPRPMSTRKPSHSPGPVVVDVAKVEEVNEEEGQQANERAEKIDEEKEQVVQGTADAVARTQADEISDDTGTEGKKELELKEEGEKEKEPVADVRTANASDPEPEVKDGENTKKDGGNEEMKGDAHESKTTTTITTSLDEDTKISAVKDKQETRAMEDLTTSSLEIEKRIVLPYTAVGDSTWEEQTWREIVRLKEVMFWARVGGMESKA